MEMPILEVINDVQEIFSNFILKSTIKNVYNSQLPIFNYRHKKMGNKDSFFPKYLKHSSK